MGKFKDKIFGKNSFNPFYEDCQKILHENMPSKASEQYKRIRENIEFVLCNDEKNHAIGVTSSMRGEGKSITSINLSYVFAQKGYKVLLIDADLRLPSVAKKMEIDNSPGLSEMLKNGEECQIKPKAYLLDNLFILPAGEIPPNPSELLGSERMRELLIKLKGEYDYIFIDLPPVNVVSDAISVSSSISGAVVVVREEYTEKNELEYCFRQLELSEIKVLGCIINDAKMEKSLTPEKNKGVWNFLRKRNKRGLKK